jgi:hypothetical protein
MQICRSDQASRTYFLDVDHPDVQTFMRDIITDEVRHGWKYLKLDFTNLIASGRVKTANRTSFESYRELYRLFREAAGAGVTINACIGCPGRFALGFADAARLGGDIGANWATVQQNLRPLQPDAGSVMTGKYPARLHLTNFRPSCDAIP